MNKRRVIVYEPSSSRKTVEVEVEVEAKAKAKAKAVNVCMDVCNRKPKGARYLHTRTNSRTHLSISIQDGLQRN